VVYFKSNNKIQGDKMKKLFLLCTLLFSFSAFALELTDAKEQGLVGEQSNGLLGVIEVSQQAADLVKDINAKRILGRISFCEINV
jgi:uncharacterized protein YdbL (DUF1318 family)